MGSGLIHSLMGGDHIRGVVVGEMTKEQMQERIQQLIRKQEQEIERLLETKRSTTDETLYIVCEQVILQKQRFIEELRALL
jgi:fatty acid/phospholipid biosynthesis enzyme